MKLGDIDRLVAERVMGMFLFQEKRECSQYTPGAFWVGDSYYAVNVWVCAPDAEAANDLCGDDIPEYSTSIADAWQVVEKMREHDFRLDYKPESGPWVAVEAPDETIAWDCPAKGKWSAGWRNSYAYEGDGWHLQACADSAPLAICLAALKAVGVEVGDVEHETR